MNRGLDVLDEAGAALILSQIMPVMPSYVLQLHRPAQVQAHVVRPPPAIADYAAGHQIAAGALLGACRVHNKQDLADIAAEALAAIEPNSCAPYVLRYNIHADEGRWEEALQVRESIDRKGLFKQPGFSWIELHNKVHSFIAGDCSHPLSEEIYSLIEICNRLSRDPLMDLQNS